MKQLVSIDLPLGHRVTGAKPSKDGTRIWVTVEDVRRKCENCGTEMLVGKQLSKSNKRVCSGACRTAMHRKQRCETAA